MKRGFGMVDNSMEVKEVATLVSGPNSKMYLFACISIGSTRLTCSEPRRLRTIHVLA
jgi:hypothetical protein